MDDGNVNESVMWATEAWTRREDGMRWRRVRDQVSS